MKYERRLFYCLICLFVLKKVSSGQYVETCSDSEHSDGLNKPTIGEFKGEDVIALDERNIERSDANNNSKVSKEP